MAVHHVTSSHSGVSTGAALARAGPHPSASLAVMSSEARPPRWEVVLVASVTGVQRPGAGHPRPAAACSRGARGALLPSGVAAVWARPLHELVGGQTYPAVGVAAPILKVGFQGTLRGFPQGGFFFFLRLLWWCPSSDYKSERGCIFSLSLNTTHRAGQSETEESSPLGLSWTRKGGTKM